MYDNLYAPWRNDYVQHSSDTSPTLTCPFCYHLLPSIDEEALGMLYQDESVYIVMNRYPYSPGHLLVIPHRHVEHLESLDPEVWIHMNTLAYKLVPMLKQTLNAHGINIGINLGEASGAGIAQHLHLHLLPRWQSDTNFMTTIAKQRVYSSDFHALYRTIKEDIKGHL